MLFGFELFSCLRDGLKVEVIEVYPFAIVRELLPTRAHKSTEKGYQDQLAAVAARTGWEPSDLEKKLKEAVPGSRHDRLTRLRLRPPRWPAKWAGLNRCEVRKAKAMVENAPRARPIVGCSARPRQGVTP
jgi:hypothetical protein